jgi:hypothetical protein
VERRRSIFGFPDEADNGGVGLGEVADVQVPVVNADRGVIVSNR